MGRYLWGLGFGFVLLLGFPPAPSAGAIGIPPTAECRTFLRKAFDEQSRNGGVDKISAAEERELAIGLQAEGCISSALPFYKPFVAEVYAPQCYEAASAANDYWTSVGRQFYRVARPFARKVDRPYRKRIRALDQRIRTSRKNGRTARAEGLARRRKEANDGYRERSRVFLKRIMPVFRELSFGTYLVIYEFVSRRCVDVENSDFEKPNTPVLKSLRKNFGWILVSSFYFILRYADDLDSQASARTASLPLIEAEQISGLLRSERGLVHLHDVVFDVLDR
jgi:hypothetical protein